MINHINESEMLSDPHGVCVSQFKEGPDGILQFLLKAPVHFYDFLQNNSR